MRRLALLVIAVLLLAGAALFAWRWWTTPPAVAERALVDAAGEAPADADGVLILGDFSRTARWLSRHPQALALLAVAAGDAEPALRRLAPTIAALGSESENGTVATWWREDHAEAFATVAGGALAPLRLVCARQGLAIAVEDVGDGLLRVAVASRGATGPAARTLAPPAAGTESAVALCLTRGRWWWVRAGRARLAITTGTPPQLPAPDGASTIETGDLAGLFRPLLPAEALPHRPARLRLAGRDWAVSLPEARLSKQVEALLRSRGDEPATALPGARHWRGILGEVWGFPGKGITIASRPEGLRLGGGAIPAGDGGVLRGGDLTALLQRLADALARVPFQDARGERLRRAAALASGVRTVRWRIGASGGRIEVEW